MSMMLLPTLTPLLSRTTRNTWMSLEGGRHSSQTLTSVTKMQATKTVSSGHVWHRCMDQLGGGDIYVQIQDYIVASTQPLHAVPQNVCTVLSFVRLTTVSSNSTTENMEIQHNRSIHKQCLLACLSDNRLLQFRVSPCSSLS